MISCSSQEQLFQLQKYLFLFGQQNFALSKGKCSGNELPSAMHTNEGDIEIEYLSRFH